MLATLVAPHAATGADLLRPTATASAAPDTVLIAEDDDGIAELLQLILRRTRRRVIRARTAAECLALFAREADRVAIAVLDCTLPDGHGVGICRQLRQRTAELPVLFVSGRDLTALRALFGDEAPTRFIAKPFLPATVLDAVHELGGVTG